LQGFPLPRPNTVWQQNPCPRRQTLPAPNSRAQKELNIEKQLKRIEDTWRGLALEFVPYQDTDVNSLHVSPRDRGGADMPTELAAHCSLISVTGTFAAQQLPVQSGHQPNPRVPRG
jgi:hypothetical protein